MEAALYYTFSTISQTLAAAIALTGAFVLYRYSLMNTAIEGFAAQLKTHFKNPERAKHHSMRTLILEGKYAEIVKLAEAYVEGGMGTIEIQEFKIARKRLEELLQQKTALGTAFRKALWATVTLIFGSVAVLVVTPAIADRWAAVPMLTVGLLWFGWCLWLLVQVLHEGIAA